MSKSLRIDFYVVLGIVFLAVPVILYFQVRPLTSAFFFFAIPAAYLFLRKKKPIKELVVGSLLLGGVISFIFDIIASVNHVWYIPISQLIINYRIFGFWPVDEIMWFILWAFSILTFYEHFYEKDRADLLSKRLKYLLAPSVFAFLLILFLAALAKDKLLFSYAYSVSMIPIIIPLGYVVRYRPNMLLKFIKTGAFFFMVFLLHELTAIKLGQWQFPGQYIGWVELFGLRFPFEELLFWMGLSTFVVLTIYEAFVDNDK